MDVQYSPDTQQWAEGFPLLKEASALLADILKPQASQFVKAQWDRVQDHQGRTLSRLTLRDFAGEVATEFTPDELANPLHMRVRLSRLWGDLLQVRNDQEHHQVQLISGQLATAAEGH